MSIDLLCGVWADISIDFSLVSRQKSMQLVLLLLLVLVHALCR